MASIDKTRAKQWFRDIRKLQGPIKVPGWGVDGEPGDIYFRTPNGIEDQAISELWRDDERGLFKVFCRRALDADGNQIWNDAEVDVLMREYDPREIAEILGKMQYPRDLEDPANQIRLSDAEIKN